MLPLTDFPPFNSNPLPLYTAATTASPVSGADVRERLRVLQMLRKIHHSVHIISLAYIKYRKEKARKRLAALEELALTRSGTNETDETIPSEDSSH